MPGIVLKLNLGIPMLGLSNLVLLKEIVLGTCFFCDEVWEWGIFFIIRASAG